MAPRVVVLHTGDALVQRGLTRAAPQADLLLVGPDDPAAVTAAAPVVVVDLDAPGAIETIERWRARAPDSFIAAHSGNPQRDLWAAAERAGSDFVANRGALAGQLVARLPPEGAARRTRTPLIDVADLAGRLGVVLRAADTPVGPIALYQVTGGVFAVGDRCPHAGACISEGDLEGPVVTCPRHGSRFDVRTGARVRGPADDALLTFELAEDGGVLYLVSDAPGSGPAA